MVDSVVIDLQHLNRLVTTELTHGEKVHPRVNQFGDKDLPPGMTLGFESTFLVDRLQEVT